MQLTYIAFGIGMLAAAGVYTMYLVTLLTSYRLWPPGTRSGIYYLHWMLVGIFFIALVTVAVRNWNSWLLPRPATLVLGASLITIGTTIFNWAASAMRLEETTGITGKLYTDGPYSCSRHPQYVGLMINYIGLALLINSALTALLAALHIGWLVLLPYVEEPHLRQTYGEAYEQYAARVPRFVDWRTFQRLYSNLTSR